MKKIIILLFIFSFTTLESKQQKFNSVNAFKSMINLKLLASSYLIEKGRPYNFYAPEKAFDNNTKTAWVEGRKGDGIGEWIVIAMKSKPGVGVPQYEDYIKNKKQLVLTFEIINGLIINRTLFKANNRVKKAILEIYSAEIRPAQGGIYIDSAVTLNSRIELNLKDTMQVQKFTLKIKSKPKYPIKSGLFLLMGRLIIKEVYRGSKYRDTCISEIKLLHVGDPKPLFP